MSRPDLDLSKDDRAAEETLIRLAEKADDFEGYPNGHAERLATLADHVAKEMKLGGRDRITLRLAALAHDLGELAMRRDYLSRSDNLSNEERLDLIRHSVIGEQEAAKAGADRGAQLLVRWHHEWWNGCGYPDALRGDEIPIGARIIRLVDSYCALTDDRPMRKARGEEEARRHLMDSAGLEFDPEVVRVFLALRNVPELRSFVRATAPVFESSNIGV